MNWFSHCYHGQRYCSWARTHDGGVAQHGGHTPNNILTDMQPWFTVYFFDIGNSCYDQLTPVKTRYLLTSIKWPYGGLKTTTHWDNVCFKLTADQVPVLDWIAGSCQVNLLKTEQDCSEVNVFGCFVLCLWNSKQKTSPQSYKTQIKILPFPGLA